MKLAFTASTLMISMFVVGPISLAKGGIDILSIERRVRVTSDLIPIVEELTWFNTGRINSTVSIDGASASQVSNVDSSGFPMNGRLKSFVDFQIDSSVFAESVFTMDFRVTTVTDFPINLRLTGATEEVFSLIRDPDGVREYVASWTEGDSFLHNDFTPSFNLTLQPDIYRMSIRSRSIDGGAEIGFFIPSPGAGVVLGVGLFACSRRRGVGDPVC